MIISCETRCYETKQLLDLLGIDPHAVQISQQAVQVINDASGKVANGNRNVYLASLAGTLRRRGLDLLALETALLAANSSCFTQPLPVYEVQRIAASISRYAPTYAASDARKSLNDVGNAARLVDLFGDDIKFVNEAQCWLVWDGSLWVKDGGVQLMELSKITVRTIYDEIAMQTDPDVIKDISRHAHNSHNLPRLRNMQEIASRDPLIAISANQLDQNPMLLGVANGVINLRTGKIRAYSRDDLITQHSPVIYDQEAKCPQFWKFLNRITRVFDHIPNPKVRRKLQKELIAYLLRLLGYCLTGRADDQVMFFFYGSGANGKSTLLNVIADLLGVDMAKQTPPETLMASTREGKPSNDLARLHRTRVVTANEIDDGSFLSENLVKQLTGGDTISCRFLYAEFFEYRPTFKLIICGNHKPVIRGTDHGIWRRIQLVPFEVKIPPEERDPYLGDKLRAELPGILNVVLAGCRDWQRRGLQPPKIITAAVEEYREEMDILGMWIKDECEHGPDKKYTASSAYSNYKFWAEREGLRPMTNAAFGRRLRDRGYEKKRESYGNVYLGIGPVGLSMPMGVSPRDVFDPKPISLG